jgi:hypothetical protein
VPLGTGRDHADDEGDVMCHGVPHPIPGAGQQGNWSRLLWLGGQVG